MPDPGALAVVAEMARVTASPSWSLCLLSPRLAPLVLERRSRKRALGHFSQKQDGVWSVSRRRAGCSLRPGDSGPWGGRALLSRVDWLSSEAPPTLLAGEAGALRHSARCVVGTHTPCIRGLEAPTAWMGYGCSGCSAVSLFAPLASADRAQGCPLLRPEGPVRKEGLFLTGLWLSMSPRARSTLLLPSLSWASSLCHRACARSGPILDGWARCPEVSQLLLVPRLPVQPLLLQGNTSWGR